MSRFSEDEPFFRGEPGTLPDKKNDFPRFIQDKAAERGGGGARPEIPDEAAFRAELATALAEVEGQTQDALVMALDARAIFQAAVSKHIMTLLGRLRSTTLIPAADKPALNTLATDEVRNLRSRLGIDGAAAAAVVKTVSATETELVKKSLLGVLKEMETTGGLGNTDSQYTFERIVGEKVTEMAATIPDAVDRAAFVELVNSCIVPLFEFGVLTPASLSGDNMTVKNKDVLLDNLNKEAGNGVGAETFNVALNKNHLVNSGDVDLEWFSPRMGIIQKIVCASYHLQREAYDAHHRPTRFGRTDAYKKGQSMAQIEHICALPNITITDEAGATQTFDIAADLARFPADVQDIIKYIALLKACRDDVGNKASNYIMLREGKSPKLGGTGSGADESGLLARSVYKAAQSANNQQYMLTWAYTDPRSPGLRGGLDYKINPPDPARVLPDKDALVAVGLWHPGEELPDPSDPRALELWRKWKRMQVYFRYRRQAWIEEGLPQIQFTPERWDQDFPAIDDFTNRVDGIAPAEYKQARAAFHELISLAYKSPNIKFARLDYNLIKLEIEKRMSHMMTKIAEYFAYVPNPGYDSHSGLDKPLNPNNRYHRYHEMTLSAVQFYLSNLLMNIPIILVDNRKSLYMRIVSGGENRPNLEAMQLFEQCVSVVVQQIDNYPSIKGVFATRLKEVAQANWIKPSYINPTHATNRFHSAAIVLDPALSALPPYQRSNQYEKPVLQPFEPAEDTTPDH